jgi:hypothetical protein
LCLTAFYRYLCSVNVDQQHMINQERDAYSVPSRYISLLSVILQ